MGALRFALLLCLRLRAQPERGGNRVHAPYCLVNGGGTRTERKGAGGNTPQVGDNMWTAAQPRIEGGREPSLEWGSTSMEGTSGAAERVSLRGAAREAALAPVAAVKAVSFPGGLASSSRKPGEHRELLSGPAGRSRNRASGAPRLRVYAQAGAPGGLVMGTRHHVCARRRRPLQPASRRALRQQVSEPIGSG
jgi:hypothetical protein